MSNNSRNLLAAIAMAYVPVVILVPAVRAESPVFVDDDGLCGGNAPCFTTIQAGVNNATDPDSVLSGAAAEVIVYPGTYAESVDLNLMGSAVGGAAGDIELRAADANDRPVIDSGAMIGLHAFMAYPGHVSIDGFDVAAGSAAGIDLPELAGGADVRNVVATGMLTYGVVVSAVGDVDVENVDASMNAAFGVSVRSLGGSVSFLDVIADGNAAEGIIGSASGAVDIDTCSANRNNREGVRISSAGSVGIILTIAESNDESGFDITSNGPVLHRACQADDNDGHGIAINQATGVFIELAHAQGNAVNGIYVAASGDVIVSASVSEMNGGAGLVVFSPTGSVTISEIIAEGNLGAGVDLSTSAGDVAVSQSVASANGGRGLSVSAEGAVTINSVVADRNGGNGLNIIAGGDVDISSFVAGENGESGLRVDVAGDVTISSAVAYLNTLYGMQVITIGALIQLTDVVAFDNGLTGVSASAAGQLLMTDVEARRNGFDGFNVAAVDGMVVNGVEAHLNQERGMLLACNGPMEISNTAANENGLGTADPGIVVGSAASLLMSNTSAMGNGGPGLSLNPAGDISVLGSRADDNGGDGMHIITGGSVLVSDFIASFNGFFGVFVNGGGKVRLEDVFSYRNTDGVRVTGDGPKALNRVSALENGGYGITLRLPPMGGSFVDAFAIDAVDVRGNNLDGIAIFRDFTARGEPARGGGEPGERRINGSIFCDNGGYGLFLGTEVEVDARGNFWGHESGPTHPNNPGGIGEGISDSVTGGQGLVDYSSWISRVQMTSDPPTPFVGMTAELRFVISDDTETFFLGEGPGAANGFPPIFVITNNGVFTVQDESGPLIFTFVNQPGGVATVLYTPGTTGSALITLEICGLQLDARVDVDSDCNENGVPDSEELTDNDCNENLVPDDCEPDCNENGLADDCDLGLLTTMHSASGNFVIPDDDPAGVTSTFDVVDNGTIADLDVGLVIEHAWNGDLTVTLSHGGVTVELIDRPGLPGLTFGFRDLGFDIVLDDDAPLEIETFNSGGIKVYGRFRPNSPLAAFNGMDKLGGWTLVVTDHKVEETGQLTRWSLAIVIDTGEALSADCNDNRIPDECEPDCNENGIVDECDIRDGTSGDLNGNGVPDECEPDCNENGVPDDTDVTGVFHYLFNVDPPLVIDNLLPPAVDTRTIPDVPVTGIIADVDVGVRLTHEWIADFEIILSHGAENVVLWAFSCNGHQDMDVIFDDEMTLAVTCTSPLTGRVPPEEPLSAFDGMDIAGDWTLTVSDGFGSLSGELLAWSLIIQRESAANSADCNENRVPDECEADCNENGIPDECDGGCPAGPEQAVPMDDMTTDFKTDNAQGQPCGDCGKMDPLWYLVSLCGYVGVVAVRRRSLPGK